MSWLLGITVFLLAGSPVGGVAAAVAAGLAAEMPLHLMMILAVVGSLVPAAILPPLIQLVTRHPRIGAFLEKRRTAKGAEFFRTYGVWGVATVGRFVLGPYGSVVTMEVFGVSRRKQLLAFALGSVLLTSLFTFLALGGLELLGYR